MGIFENFPYSNFHELNNDWIVAEVKRIRTEWDAYRSGMDEWQEGVDQQLETFQTWFDNLDVQEEVRVVVREMVADGTFLDVATPTITSTTESWLAAHVNPDTGYVIDDTLTIANAAADAKATGDQITDLKSALDNVIQKTGGNAEIGRTVFTLNSQWADSLSTKYMINLSANTPYIFRFHATDTITTATIYLTKEDDTVVNLGNKNADTDIQINVDYNVKSIHMYYSASIVTTTLTYYVYHVYNSTFVTYPDLDAVKDEIGDFTLFDGAVDEWDEGYYILYATGNAIAHPSWDSTPYIEIIENCPLIIATANSAANVGVAFYDADKVYISGVALVWDSTSVKEFSVTSPQTAKYMRYSATHLPAVTASSYAKINDSLLNISKNIEERVSALENAVTPEADIPWQLAMDKVLCIGDSLTSGAYYDGSTYNGASIAQNYPYFLSRILDTDVVNAGVSGITPVDWLANEYPDYTYTDYNTIIIWLGSNGGLLETLPENPTEGQTIAHNNYTAYRQLVTNLQTANPNALIVVCLIYFTNYWVDISNQALNKIATDFSLPVVDLSDLNATNYPELRYVDENQYHLIKCGNIVVASRITDSMKTWFAESPQRCEFGLSPRID